MVLGGMGIIGTDELAAKTSEAIAARKETASANLTMDGMARQLAGKVGCGHRYYTAPCLHPGHDLT